MRNSFSLFLTLISISLSAQNPDERAIREVLAMQQECWNDGDLECFMEGYWKSDQLVFIGSKGVTYGWQATLDNYKKSYPDKEKMGILTFDLISLEPLSEDFWTVIGKWSLKRKSDNPNGHFSLIFRRLGDEWVIVSDHSS
ncbi:Ketosteroid isomerase homolog [Ekhidna lutea]|uniref:Ketosteroid isomerase homolog n=1 Tax=Ekhidna lutea TaxID=447679 RepID=A0A239JFZ6_EKHLU|nr:nuclear transport factor 2 family protein [Ekhidna lutea]SNT04747.1 Ketosteroid isomerase homolog [Ekhidna lutea]